MTGYNDAFLHKTAVEYGGSTADNTYNIGAAEVVLTSFAPQFVTSGRFWRGEKSEIEGETEGGGE